MFIIKRKIWFMIAIAVALLLHLGFPRQMKALHHRFITLSGANASRHYLLDFQTEQAQRLAVLEEACRRRNRTSHVESVRGIAIKSLKLFYCQIPKVGMTTLKRILYLMENNRTDESPFAIDGLSIHAIIRRRPDVSIEDLALPDRYRKFLFVRDPYKRLFSAYIDKLFILVLPNEKFHETFKMETHNKIMCFKDVTFLDAVEYVLGMRSKRKDLHFLPQHILCPPCSIQYDFIGKFETYRRDIDNILNSININYLSGSMESLASSSDLNIIRDLTRRTMKNQRFNCTSPVESFRKIWKALQIRGILSIHKVFPVNSTDEMSSERFIHIVQKTYLSQTVSDDRARQRDMAYKEAFRSIPMGHLYKLKDLFTEDCELFGYDCEPPEIFQRSSVSEPLHFFDFGRV